VSLWGEKGAPGKEGGKIGRLILHWGKEKTKAIDLGGAIHLTSSSAKLIGLPQEGLGQVRLQNLDAGDKNQSSQKRGGGMEKRVCNGPSRFGANLT